MTVYTCSSFNALSHVFSLVSLLSWIVAQLPQVYANYLNKSTSSISPFFLGLWFLGDSLSFISVLLNNVLPFQVFLSIFFVSNDVLLLGQKYYYAYIYKRNYYIKIIDGVEVHLSSGESSVKEVDSDEANTSSVSTHLNQPHLMKTAAVGVVMNMAGSSAASIFARQSHTSAHPITLGVFLAWCCTVIYMCSRVPQVYKNYQRKSVEGISPILFGSALCGNISYTISLLTSCDFAMADSAGKHAFLIRQLPYIMGSSGTVVFDLFYFYQRHIYRKDAPSSACELTETTCLITENSEV